MFVRFPCAAALTAVGCLAPAALAQPIANDFTIEGLSSAFGEKVAIEGDEILVNGDNQIYRFDTSDTQLPGTYDAPSGAGVIEFGTWPSGDIALDGTTVVVGAGAEDTAGPNAGAAFVYDSTGAPMTQLFFPGAGQQSQPPFFGWAVAVDGDRFVVGAPGASTSAGNRSGAAYLYDTSSVQLIATLLTTDDPDEVTGEFDEDFGEAVAIDGGVVAVGSPEDSNFNLGPGADPGSVTFFDAQTGAKLFRVRASDLDDFDQFGFDVAMDDGLAVIGAPFDDDNGQNSGSAYIFDVATGDQMLKLTASDGDNLDRFGYAVDIKNGVAVVGAPFDDGNTFDVGSVYAFDASTGDQIAKFQRSPGLSNSQTGEDVAINTDGVIVASARGDIDFGPGGAAFVFSLPSPLDYNGDGSVDINDLISFINDYFGTQQPENDYNGDGTIDISDLIGFINDYFQQSP